MGALLLAPGAGSDRNQSTLLSIEAAVAPMPVARVDFPYRKEGRRAPDRAPKLLASLTDDARAFVAERRIRARRLALGGRSMGGRMASMAVADGLPAAALVLVAYPLHPPAQPEKLRVEHLAAIDVPCLFVSGTRDPFGTPTSCGPPPRPSPDPSPTTGSKLAATTCEARTTRSRRS